MSNTTSLFFNKFISQKIYRTLSDMDYSPKMINDFQRDRMAYSFILVICFALLIPFMGLGALLVGLLVGFLIYFLYGYSVETMYKNYRFNQQIEFDKFRRLLISLLLYQFFIGGNLYNTFNTSLARIKSKPARNSLMRLMDEMTETPEEIQPFLDYADRASGTNDSKDFMSSLYDMTQGSQNYAVIRSMGKRASKDIIETVTKIKEKKLDKFSYYLAFSGVLFSLLFVSWVFRIFILEIGSIKISI